MVNKQRLLITMAGGNYGRLLDSERSGTFARGLGIIVFVDVMQTFHGWLTGIDKSYHCPSHSKQA